MPETIATLLDRHTPGLSLEQAFYTSREVYEQDIQRVFFRSWLYAGHVSEIPKAGAFLLFDMAGESVIVVRDDNDNINALINVCRHRGSRICVLANGTTLSFVCPYHGWTYDLEGKLRSTRFMPENFDKSRYGLRRIHVKLVHGFIFLNFADEPVSLDELENDLEECLRPYGFESAKVAYRELYPIKANWKLMVENFIECYHCAPAHREYARSHSRRAPEAESAELRAAMMARADAVGLSRKSVDRFGSRSSQSGEQYFYDRYPLYPGYKTGSEDGAPVAPLMGEIRDYDGGAADFQIGPVTYFLAYPDYTVVYRFLPRDVQLTDCEIIWMVDGAAEEGRDYSIERLTWLWRVTTEADKAIVDRNQRGVNSRYYAPGPYSQMERFVNQYMEWYLDRLRTRKEKERGI
ncbi:MAG TPA: aromatic ring-hydroxylating dioxygenase subunit alpha [Gammaproteobacteria bacterium]|nr:aromatic ring-hydroxylating dioxygenase subunit alpha [Gammaproteobacteria bacterium]